MKIEDHQIKRNYTKGRDGHKINMVVIHIMEGWLAGTEATFNDGKREASAHYGIGLKGEVWRYVKEEDTAWHCGSTFSDNQRSIGIEHEGSVKGEHWTEAQLESSAALTAQILFAYGLTTDAIRTHVSLKPLSKHTCPGPDFPMEQYKAWVSQYLRGLRKEPEVPTLPPKPEKITMPLFLNDMELGQISFTRSTGKAFFMLALSPSGPGGFDSPSEMEKRVIEFVKRLGYGRILK